jgi:ammonium transporter Rh
MCSKMENYAFYQDVHVMIFIGFGFLMTFLHAYSWSAVGLNFLLSALAIQWSMLTLAFFHAAQHKNWTDKVKLDVNMLIGGDFAAAALMITFGAVIGKTSSTQLVAICFFEMIIYAINEMIVTLQFEAIDMGGSMIIHAFGAYFGIALSWMLGNPAKGKASPSMTKWSSTGAMIGTIFLWCYWPSLYVQPRSMSSSRHQLLRYPMLLIAVTVHWQTTTNNTV